MFGTQRHGKSRAVMIGAIQGAICGQRVVIATPMPQRAMKDLYNELSAYPINYCATDTELFMEGRGEIIIQDTSKEPA